MNFLKYTIISLILLIVGCSPNSFTDRGKGGQEKTEENKQQFKPLRAKFKPLHAIKNPARGFWVEKTHVGLQGIAVLPLSDNWIKKMNKRDHTFDDNLSLVQLYIYLTQYVGEKIPNKALDALDKLFDQAKKKGYKFVLRFAYDYNGHITNATYKDVFRHLHNLAPFIKSHKGMIAVWQRGFIGMWGEGHGSPMAHNYRGWAKMELNIFQGRQITERYPPDKSRLDRFLTDKYMRRIGYNNDFFTASEHPLAKGNDYVLGTPIYRQVTKQSPHLMVVGEMPWETDGKWGLNKIISVKKILQIFRDHHYNMFSVTHNNGLNIKHWKNYYLTPSMLDQLNIVYNINYFKNKSGNIVKRTAYEFIRDHLGYRLLFDFKATTISVNQGILKYNIVFENTGFSAIHNPRPVYLVFIDGNGKIAKKEKLDTNPDKWQPYNPDANNYQLLQHQIKGRLDVSSLTGKFKVGLWLPDPANGLKKKAQYDIIFANRNLIIWEDANNQYRINILGSVEL